MWLQRATIIDPYNEALHHQAADLLHAAGDHTGATDLIKRLHQRLADAPPSRPDETRTEGFFTREPQHGGPEN